MLWCASRTSPRGIHLRRRNYTRRPLGLWAAPHRTTASPRCVTICQSSEPRAWSRNSNTPALSPFAGRLLDLPGLSQTLRAHLHPAHRPACHSPFLRTTNINYSAFATRQALPTGRPVSRRSRPRRWPQSRLKHKHNENKIDRYHPQYARLLVTTHITVCGNRPRFWTTFGPRIL